MKMLQSEKNNNPVALSEFEIECELLARIDHPNIIKVLGAGTVPRPFIVLERLKDMTSILELDASDTRPAIFRRRAFDYLEILKLARSLADALHYLHTQVRPGYERPGGAAGCLPSPYSHPCPSLLTHSPGAS